ncbi:MAG TPA: hypothetical protein VES65_11740 [Solirubrobacteraceae bacterium]|nr:hypothetical protein [Solirubrobacteraceae bacterium]
MSFDPRAVARERRDSSVVGVRRAGSDRRVSDRANPEPPSEQSVIGRLASGGTAGNERLTTATGIVLVILLAVIGITLLRLRGLLSVHLFVGMLLIGPVALKMASTGYRFARYYTADPRYRRKGPPPASLRLIAPIVVLSTVVVLVSGLLLLLIGPSSRGTLLPIHKVSFIVWLAFTALHVLGHLPVLAAAVGLGSETVARADALAALGSRDGALPAWDDPRTAAAGRAGRMLSLAGALTGGAVLAIVLIPQFSPWLHASALSHH